jgi:DNA-binding NtrC family response regulator
MQHDIALVISDMVMPKIDGKEFMRQLRVINPKTRLLAISGYLKYVAEKDDVRNTAWFLEKPFEYRDLLLKVRQILDSPSHNPRRIKD